MEADLAWACMTSTDWHPIHVDVEYAAATQHGQRIFQGTYGTHLAVGMAIHLPPLGNAVIGALGLNGWKYCAPLFVNDTVYVEVELISKRPTGDGKRGVLERRIRLMKSDGTLAQEGVLASLIHRD
jgi:acyl dehydratase